MYAGGGVWGEGPSPCPSPPKFRVFVWGGEGGKLSPCSSSNSYYDTILQVVGMSLTYT